MVQNASYPETKVVTIGGFKFGLVHGHQVVPWTDPAALAMLQRQLDADVLISGHSHKYQAYEYADKFYVNPGSATGAYSALTRYTLAHAFNEVVRRFPSAATTLTGPSHELAHPPTHTHTLTSSLFLSLSLTHRDSVVHPSFVLMDVQAGAAVTYVYQLVDDEVKVEKIDYKKK
jgi:vacuolar protein sorting-associated protein 29